MSRTSLRVYFAEDENGLLTGRLMPRSHSLNDYSAVGRSQEEVLAQLEAQLAPASAEPERLTPFSWQEALRVDKLVVEVRPQAALGKRVVIGKHRIPIELHYAWAALAGEPRSAGPSGFRVMLPRFGFVFVLEDLGTAAEVLRQAVGAALTGEAPRSLFEFRELAREYVLEWSPRFRKSKPREAPRDDNFTTLLSVAEDWSELARAGKLGSHFGPADEQRYAELARSLRKPSLLLVGPSGVGKTEWVKELARRSVTERTTDTDARVFASSADRIIAGQTYLGMWEQRCLELIAELSGEGHYLYLDRLSDLVRVQSGASSIADLLLQALLEQRITVIAECSNEEYRLLQSRHGSLLASFQIVKLSPLDREQACAFVREHAHRLLPNAKLSAQGVVRLVRHLQTFRKAFALPGSAFGVLNWMREERSARSGAHAAEPNRPLDPREIDRLFSKYCGLGEQLISDGQATSATSLAETLATRVVGQDAACAAAAQVLARFKAGLNDPEKPIGSLLFAGPTGVGKTELAKALAQVLFGDPKRMVRLDMSEFMSHGSAQLLLSDERGSNSLVARVSQQPLNLVLFDEIEKAHPAVFDVLLALMGEGRLSTSAGRLVDFRMTLIVLTSNLGSEGARVGFGLTNERSSSLAAVKTHFRPEFVNRLDQVVSFDRLSPSALRRIVELRLHEVLQRDGFRRRNLRLSASDQVKDHLASSALDQRYGARPLARAIEDEVVTPLAVELARHPNTRNRTVLCSLLAGRVVLKLDASGEH